MPPRATDIELHALLERVVQAIQDLGWNTVTLVLRDEATRTTYPAAVATQDAALKSTLLGAPPVSFRADIWRQEQFRISRSYFVDHRLHGGAHLYADELGRGVYQIDLGPREPDEWQSDDFLIVPLESDGQELGWLSVDDPSDRQRPTVAKVRALEIFADQAAFTIQQARRHQQVREQAARQSILNEIAHTISQHLDITDLLTAVSQQLQHLFIFQRASITVRDGQRSRPRLLAVDDQRGQPSENPTALENIAFTQLILGNQPNRLVGDLSQETELEEEAALVSDGVRAYVCLPLRVWGQVLGALSLSSSTPKAFNTTDFDFLIQIADHIAGAVWNALLYDLEQQRRHLADALARLSQIVNSTLDLDEVFELALEQLQRVITYDTASIMLVEGDRLRITACRGFDNPETLIGSIFRPEENNISHQVMRAREARVEPDVQLLPEWGHQRDDIEGAHTIHAWIGTPLVVHGQSIGILTLDKHVPDFYSEEDGEAATAFAAQIAIAIQNARLYESEHRKQQINAGLAQLAQIVNSTLELDEVLELALEQLGQVVSYDTSSIMLTEGPNLVLAACRGFSHPAHVLGSVITPDEANFGYGVLLAQKTRVVADVQQTPDWQHSRDNIPDIRAIRSWIGAPLIVRGQSIGVLTIDKHEPDFYTEEDGETAAAFAAQLATAIHNARLYQAIEEQRDRLTAILTDTTDAVIVLDDSGKIWLLTPATERHFRVQRDEVLGQPIGILNLPELTQALTHVQETHTPKMLEIPGPEKTAFHASIAPVHQVGWVIVMQDISPLKELDRLRTEWVAAVSHDLKNPIQVVQLGAALLEMDGPLNAAQLDRVQMIQRSAAQLSELVTNVLDLARLEAGPSLRLMALDPADVIQAAVSEMEHLATEKRHQLKVELPEILPSLMGDAVLLKRVLANLLSNAIKYTPEGGQITLRAGLVDHTLQIEVVDNGQGIPPEALPHLFDRFYRVPGTKGDGTGLGLSIVKSIIEKHNGSIQAASTPGQGSTFTLCLPIS